jgi:hypothetical protein
MAKGRIIRPEPVSSFKLPRVGMIKTGFKDDKGNPRSCDYFIPTGKYKDLFSNVYPGQPKTVQIVFWDDNIGEMCNERYEYRDKQGKLFASGDGENFEVWSPKIEKYVSYTTAEHPDLMKGIHDKQQNGKGWEVILTLRFILPAVKDIAGFWEYSTKGEASTIPAIRDTFDAMLQARGSIKGVIFDLNVEFAKSQKPGIKSRYPVVSLIPNQSPKNLEAVKGSILLPNNQNLIGS